MWPVGHRSPVTKYHANDYHPQVSMVLPPSFTDAVSGIMKDPIGSFERAAGIGFIKEATQQLSGDMDVTQALRSVEGSMNTDLVLESVGRDLLIFLAASVVVTPVSEHLVLFGFYTCIEE